MTEIANPFKSLLAQSGRQAVVLDGGFATELESQGKDLSQDDLWSASVLANDPVAVQKVHTAYFEAGADVATTCSYQATYEGYAKAGYSASDATELLRRSIQLADDARSQYQVKHPQERPLIAFSCGPYGTVLADGSEYTGSYADKVTEEQLMDFHRSKLQAVADDPAIDILAFETVPCAKEVRAIERLLRTEGFHKPAWVSCSCRNDTETSRGEDFASEIVPLLVDSRQVVAIGFNCTAPRHIKPLIQRARAALDKANSSKLLLAYPNSGEGFVSAQGGWQGDPDLTEEQFGAATRQWVDSGAAAIGGCCRTTPAYISSVAGGVKWQ